MKRVVWFIAGILCILVGIVGLVLPGIQGIAMIVLGLSMIAPQFVMRLKKRLFRKFLKSDIVYIEEWKKLGVEAGFTTRHFPLKFSRTDDLKDKKNLESFRDLVRDSEVFRSHKLQPFRTVVLLHQVHGSEIEIFDETRAPMEENLVVVQNSDGAASCIPGVALLVFSADCLPIFFTAGKWVGIAHAGWRGTQAEIAKNMFQILLDHSGISADEVQIFFGPCIGPRHYEVGQEFRRIFQASSLIEKNKKLYFNLAKENKRQLLEAGASPKNIIDHEICTFSESRNFYSFRREGSDAGRMISFITAVEKTS